MAVADSTTNRFTVCCPKCEKSIEVTNRDIGNDAACPHCGLVYAIPARRKYTGIIPADRQEPVPRLVTLDDDSRAFLTDLKKDLRRALHDIFWVTTWLLIFALFNFIGGCAGFIAILDTL